MHEIALTADTVAPFRYGTAEQRLPQADRYEDADPIVVVLPQPKVTYEEADPLPLHAPIAEADAPAFFRATRAGGMEDQLIRR